MAHTRLVEQFVGEGVGLGLHVLGQAQGDRPRIRGRGEHAHGVQQRRDELLGAVDPVPIPRHGFQTIVDGDIQGVLGLHSLQVGGCRSAREDVAGQQQDRQPVDGRARRAGDQIRGAGADGGGAGESAEAIPHLRVADGHVNNRLLVASLEVWEVRRLLQGLAETRDYSVAENPGAAREEAALHSVPLDVLVL